MHNTDQSNIRTTPLKVYIAGPMTGYPNNNAQAFDEATKVLEAAGHTVINPSKLDVGVGVDPSVSWGEHPEETKRAISRRDLEEVISSDYVVLLPGWEGSFGASAEVAVARWMGKQIFLFPDMTKISPVPLPEESVCLRARVKSQAGFLERVFGEPQTDSPTLTFDEEVLMRLKEDKEIEEEREANQAAYFPQGDLVFTSNPLLSDPLNLSEKDREFVLKSLGNSKEDILEEAMRLTGGDRNKDYGHPWDDFSCTAEMWSSFKGVKFSPHEVAVFMILAKISRLRKSPNKRDHWVDFAGYARCGHLCTEGPPKDKSIRDKPLS